MAGSLCPEDDTVLYNVYPDSVCTSESPSTLAITCNKHVQRLSEGHIWYYEPIRFIENRDGEIHCLRGSTCFRECIDDEWFIVDLLLQLTKLCPQLVVSVEDSDGQFLLIESANVIPKWLKPDTAVNRVFLYQGAVHIVGSPTTPSDVGMLPVATPTLSQSINCIRSIPHKTVASTELQQAINNRIQRSRPRSHSAHCLLPIPAAYILSTHSQLVSAVVHAFCDRGKEEMKIVRKLEDFSPDVNEMVVTTVRFPRLLYAKLSHQQWNIPQSYVSTVNQHQYKTGLLGMKLTYGLEILSRCYSRHAPQSHNQSGWSKLLSSLKGRGYFKGELEGSELYQELLSNAKEYYHHNIEKMNDGSWISVLEEAGSLISKELEANKWTEAGYCMDTPPPHADDDSWLDLTADGLDSILETHSNNPPPSHKSQTQSHSDPVSSLELDEVVFGMKSFVDRVSSVDGAEFPWSASSGGDTQQVQFDPDMFVSTIESLMEKLNVATGDDVTASHDDSSFDSDSEASNDDECDEDMVRVMDDLNQELSTFSNIHHRHGNDDNGGVAGDKEGAVNIEYDVVANLLESYSEQVGGAGPATNIINSLGIKFPEQK